MGDSDTRTCFRGGGGLVGSSVAVRYEVQHETFLFFPFFFPTERNSYASLDHGPSRTTNERILGGETSCAATEDGFLEPMIPGFFFFFLMIWYARRWFGSRSPAVGEW